MAERRNLRIDQGDDEEWTLPVTSGGSAADLSSYTATAQIRRQAGDSTAIDIAIDPSDMANGNIGLSLDANTTAAMEGEYVWDCQIDDGVTVTTVARGSVVVTPEVTRPADES